jgi:general secretion pathway protein J
MSVTAQRSAERALDDAGEVRRASALLAADLANAAPRLRRDEAGMVRAPFEASAEGFVLVRRGRENPDGEARSSLQRVEYRLADGRLERSTAEAVDGAPADRRAVLVEKVRGMSLRFRSADGAWRERWDPEDARSLPRAVEMVLETERHGAVRQLFLVGSAT